MLGRAHRYLQELREKTDGAIVNGKGKANGNGHVADGNGHIANGPQSRRVRSSAFPVPHSELVLYSYAQLVGTITVTPLPNSPLTQEQEHALLTVRNALTRTKGVGGGSMDIATHTPRSLLPGQQISHVSRRTSHFRSPSLSAGLFSLLSPTSISMPSSPTSSAQPWTPSHRSRASSVFSTLFSSGISMPPSPHTGLGIGLSNSTEMDDIDPDAPLPMFEVQPKMLAVDLTLAPGESRCCA